MEKMAKDYEKDLRIGKKIIAVLVLLVIFFICTITLSYRAIHIMAGNNRNVSNTHATLNLITSLKAVAYSAESTQRGFLLTINERYLSSYNSDKAAAYELINRLSEAKTESGDQVERFKLLKDLVLQKFDEMDRTLSLANSGDTKGAQDVVKNNQGFFLMEGILKIINEMEVSERDLVVKNQQAAKKRREEFLAILVSSNIVGLLVTLFTCAMLLHNRKRLIQYHQKLSHTNAHLNDLVRERTAELDQYADELKRSNQELQNFAFVASHDLQEPLRKIRAFGDRLKSTCADQLNEKGMDYLGRMLSASERMSVLISDILRYARISQNAELTASIALNDVVDEALGNLEIAIYDSAASVVVEPLPVVRGDKSQLVQVFTNLIANAIKFRNVEIPLHISITCDVAAFDLDQPLAEIKISDNGIGFDRTYVGKIFEIFQRLHAKDAFAGTGIGLAVCKKIIERHGGSISADSDVGQGATFTLTLPIAPTGAIPGATNGIE